eukprot:Rmarinus@m.15385
MKLVRLLSVLLLVVSLVGAQELNEAGGNTLNGNQEEVLSTDDRANERPDASQESNVPVREISASTTSQHSENSDNVDISETLSELEELEALIELQRRKLELMKKAQISNPDHTSTIPSSPSPADAQREEPAMRNTLSEPEEDDNGDTDLDEIYGDDLNQPLRKRMRKLTDKQGYTLMKPATNNHLDFMYQVSEHESDLGVVAMHMASPTIELEGEGLVSGVAIIADDVGRISFVEIATGMPLENSGFLSGHTSKITRLAMSSRDVTVLASGDATGCVLVHRLEFVKAPSCAASEEDDSGSQSCAVNSKRTMTVVHHNTTALEPLDASLASTCITGSSANNDPEVARDGSAAITGIGVMRRRSGPTIIASNARGHLSLFYTNGTRDSVHRAWDPISAIHVGMHGVLFASGPVIGMYDPKTTKPLATDCQIKLYKDHLPLAEQEGGRTRFTSVTFDTTLSEHLYASTEKGELVVFRLSSDKKNPTCRQVQIVKHPRRTPTQLLAVPEHLIAVDNTHFTLYNMSRVARVAVEISQDMPHEQFLARHAFNPDAPLPQRLPATHEPLSLPVPLPAIATDRKFLAVLLSIPHPSSHVAVLKLALPDLSEDNWLYLIARSPVGMAVGAVVLLQLWRTCCRGGTADVRGSRRYGAARGMHGAGGVRPRGGMHGGLHSGVDQAKLSAFAGNLSSSSGGGGGGGMRVGGHSGGRYSDFSSQGRVDLTTQPSYE